MQKVGQKCNPQAVAQQFNRTEGQVAGVGRMIAERREATDVLQQIVAARASLQKLGIMLLQMEAQGCFGNGEKNAKLKDLEKVVEGLFKIT